MSPVPIIPAENAAEVQTTTYDPLIPVLSAAIPVFIGMLVFVAAAVSYRSRHRRLINAIFCVKVPAEHESGRRQQKIAQSSPLKNPPPFRYPIDISTITRTTLPTIPEAVETYSQLGGINFLPNLSSTQLKKSITGTIFRTPSDVPRTAELLESDSGPGKTVTVSSKPRISYQSEYHKISGIVPLKDSTGGASEHTYSYSGLVLNHTPTNLTNLSNLQFMQSSAGVNICILSPDVNISKQSMIFASRVSRNLSASFSSHEVEKSPRRINNTPVELRSDAGVERFDQEKMAINQALAEQELSIKHYRELFIPGISYPTLPTIFPMLRHAEHWV